VTLHLGESRGRLAQLAGPLGQRGGDCVGAGGSAQKIAFRGGDAATPRQGSFMFARKSVLLKTASHLVELSSWPMSAAACLIRVISDVTWRDGPPILASSKYQMFRSLWPACEMSLMARAKKSGPRGSSCYTPLANGMVKSPYSKVDVAL